MTAIMRTLEPTIIANTISSDESRDESFDETLLLFDFGAVSDCILVMSLGSRVTDAVGLGSRGRSEEVASIVVSISLFDFGVMSDFM